MTDSLHSRVKALIDAVQFFVNKCDKNEINGVDKAFLAKCRTVLAEGTETLLEIGALDWQPMETAPKDQTDLFAVNERDVHAIITWNGEYWVHAIVDAVLEIPPKVWNASYI